MNIFKSLYEIIKYQIDSRAFDKYRHQRHKLLLENYRNINQNRIEVNKLYTNSLQLIDSGAIVVSFTYILQTKIQLQILPLLVLFVSWILLLTAIIKSLYSHKLSCKLHDDALELENLRYAKDISSITRKEQTKLSKLERSSKKDRKIIIKINDHQFRFTIAGLFFLAVFIVMSMIQTNINYSINPNDRQVQKENRMSMKEKKNNSSVGNDKKKEKLNDGYAPPRTIPSPDKPVKKPIKPISPKTKQSLID